MNRRWLCNNVWLDVLPLFDRPQLGLKVAVLSPRFNALVDTHFDGTELTLWKPIAIRNDGGTATPHLAVLVEDDVKSVPFELPDAHSPPMPNNIRFRDLRINYIDHAVIAFLRANKQIFNKGTNVRLSILSKHSTSADAQPIWDAFVRHIWPIFAPTIRHFWFLDGHHLDTLLLISPSILTDDQINIHSINSGPQFPEAIDEEHFDGSTANYDGSIATSAAAGQALSKWLHISRNDGQPKELRFHNYSSPPNIGWINNFKKKFLRATANSVSYKIQFKMYVDALIAPFELVNERTQEKLRLVLANATPWGNEWIMRRCPIGETAAIYWEEENWHILNTVNFWLRGGSNGIGLLYPPQAAAEDEEAGQNSDNEASSDNE